MTRAEALQEGFGDVCESVRETRFPTRDRPRSEQRDKLMSRGKTMVVSRLYAVTQRNMGGIRLLRSSDTTTTSKYTNATLTYHIRVHHLQHEQITTTTMLSDCHLTKSHPSKGPTSDLAKHKPPPQPSSSPLKHAVFVGSYTKAI